MVTYKFVPFQLQRKAQQHCRFQTQKYRVEPGSLHCMLGSCHAGAEQIAAHAHSCPSGPCNSSLLAVAQEALCTGEFQCQFLLHKYSLLTAGDLQTTLAISCEVCWCLRILKEWHTVQSESRKESKTIFACFSFPVISFFSVEQL